MRAIRATQTEQRRVGNRIITTFDQLVPGAFINTKRFARAHPDLPVPKPLATRPLERQLVEALITLCPNPYDVLQLGHQGIIDLFHHHGYRCGPKTADKILNVIERALLPPPDIAPAFASVLQREQEPALSEVEGSIGYSSISSSTTSPSTHPTFLTTTPSAVAGRCVCTATWPRKSKVASASPESADDHGNVANPQSNTGPSTNMRLKR